MRQFDVFRPMGGAGPLLLVLQADELSPFNVVVAAPLYRADEWEQPTRDLQPVLDVAGEEMVLVTNHLAAIPCNRLGTRVGSLADRRHDIIAALDFLFTGI
jgi:toxin CcdB